MATRVVEFTLNDINGSPIEGAVFVFKLLQWGAATDSPIYLRQGKKATATDAAGQSSITLWINESGVGGSEKDAVYRVSYPSGESAEFILPSGAGAIDLSDLTLNYAPTGAVQQSSQALDLKADRNAGNIGDPAQANPWRAALSVETSAELNARDTANRARANHTGQQLASTISNFDAAVEANPKVAGIEALADVTDTANVTAAGALMDTEVDADIKTLSLPANTTISAFAATVLDDTTQSAARTTLGLGVGDAPEFNGADMDGGELVLDVDGDTSIRANTPNQIDFKLGGVVELTLTAAKADNLDDIAAIAPADSTILVGDGTNWVAESGATARTTLGLTIGTNVQAWNDNLDDLAALTPSDEAVLRGNGTDWVIATNFRIDAGTLDSGTEMGTGTANGDRAVAEGSGTVASGDNSHAEGFSTTASDENSHAEGTASTASGFSSHAEGRETTASAPASHAEGFLTTASGDNSHAEGLSTTASGITSSATGTRGKAIHNGARVEADGQNADVSSTTTDQFTARFQNGYVFKGGNFLIEATIIRSKSIYTGTDTTDNVYQHVCNSAASFTLTVTDGTADGQEIKIMNRGAGAVTLSGNISIVTALTSLLQGETTVLNWDSTLGEWE